jgi:hypothetical protein
MSVRWFVRSEDGASYIVGVWRDGEWIDGNQADAERELRALDEPGAWIWSRSQRPRNAR